MDDKKTCRIGVDFRRELWDRVKRQAAEHGRTATAQLHLAVEIGLDTLSQQKFGNPPAGRAADQTRGDPGAG